MPMKTKMTSLNQEVVRRLLNCRPTLEWNECQAPILSKFSRKMERSGWGDREREDITKGGVKAYERKLEAARKGERPMYRPREWRSAERRKRATLRRGAWYRPADAVGFFPPTPRGELVSKIRQVLEEEGKRI